MYKRREEPQIATECIQTN